jgi:hypothetical protein
MLPTRFTLERIGDFLDEYGFMLFGALVLLLAALAMVGLLDHEDARRLERCQQLLAHQQTAQDSIVVYATTNCRPELPHAR